MSMKQRNKSTWLFSFTDLSFLLLISLSLIPDTAGDFSLRLAKMDLPSVPESPTLQSVVEPQETWELHILSAAGSQMPFRLVHSGGQQKVDCNEETLLPALENLRDLDIKPMLLPDRASLSKDFLFAAGALARVWSGAGNQVVVKPVPARGRE